MTKVRICTLAALVAALPCLAAAPASANHKITVNYDTSDTSGVVCVEDAPAIKNSDKNLKIKKLNQVITWELKRGQGTDAGGTWLVQKDAGGSIEMCPDTVPFSNGVATCTIGAELEYAYELIWRKDGCASVVADPAVIFDDGGGGPDSKFTLLGPIAGLILGLVLGFAFARRRRVAS